MISMYFNTRVRLPTEGNGVCEYCATAASVLFVHGIC